MTQSSSPHLKLLSFLSIPLLWWGSSAFASGWLNPSLERQNFEFLQFAVHSSHHADYGIDTFTVPMAPIDPSIIQHAQQDNGTTITTPTSQSVFSSIPTPTLDGDDEEIETGTGDDGGPVSPAPTAKPTPEPTTDPGNNGNGNGNGGGNGNDGNNGGGGGNSGDNGNAGGNGNGGNGGGNGGGKDKDKGKPESFLPDLLGVLARL